MSEAKSISLSERQPDKSIWDLGKNLGFHSCKLHLVNYLMNFCA